MSDVVVLECRNPEALNLPQVVDLFRRAFDFEHFPDAEEARSYLVATLPSDELALFFVRDEAGLLGMAVIQAVKWCFGAPGPMILHFYCPKHEDARLALAEALRVWARDRGARRVYACHRSPLRDDDFIGRFDAVADGRVVGSFLEFDSLREEPVAW